MKTDNFGIDFNKALNLDFYLQDTEIVAKNLIGKVLVRKIDGIILSGEIVETEAYMPFNDAANHSAKGKTSRNSAMFENGGIFYVYKIYGVHHCINVVTDKSGLGSAVLIRALRPFTGIDGMKTRRRKTELVELCNGPGKLAQALSFTTNDNCSSMLLPDLYIQDFKSYNDIELVNTPRIGINVATDLNLRYYLKKCEYVSRFRKN